MTTGFKELREIVATNFALNGNHIVITNTDGKVDSILAALEIAERYGEVVAHLPRLSEIKPLDPEYARLMSENFWELFMDSTSPLPPEEK